MLDGSIEAHCSAGADDVFADGFICGSAGAMRLFGDLAEVGHCLCAIEDAIGGGGSCVRRCGVPIDAYPRDEDCGDKADDTGFAGILHGKAV